MRRWSSRIRLTLAAGPANANWKRISPPLLLGVPLLRKPLQLIGLAALALAGCGRDYDQQRLAQNVYVECLNSHARAMYHGTDSPQLEQAVADSCQQEFGRYMTTMHYDAHDRAAFANDIPKFAHAAVREAVEGRS